VFTRKRHTFFLRIKPGDHKDHPYISKSGGVFRGNRLEKSFLMLYDDLQEEIMKSRTFTKKLVLKKETVAHLNRIEMKNVPGGMDFQIPGNPPIGTWTTDCCPSIIVGCEY
jgi:hypothetical protein